MTPPWPWGRGWVCSTASILFPIIPRTVQSNLTSGLSYPGHSSSSNLLVARSLEEFLKFYFIDEETETHMPNTQESARDHVSSPEARMKTHTSDSQARALSSTDRCPPALAGWIIGIPVEDCRCLNKPKLNILAYSGAVYRRPGLESWLNVFLFFQSPQSSYHYDPLTLGTNSCAWPEIWNTFSCSNPRMAGPGFLRAVFPLFWDRLRRSTINSS